MATGFEARLTLDEPIVANEQREQRSSGTVRKPLSIAAQAFGHAGIIWALLFGPVGAEEQALTWPGPITWEQEIGPEVICPHPSLRGNPFGHEVRCTLASTDFLHSLARNLRLSESGRAVVDTVNLAIAEPVPAEADMLESYARDRLICLMANRVDETVGALRGERYQWTRQALSLAELSRSSCSGVPGPWQTQVVEDAVLIRIVGLYMQQFRAIAGEMALLEDEEDRLSGIFGRPFERPPIPNPNLGFADESLRLSTMAADLASSALAFLDAAERKVRGQLRSNLFAESWMQATIPSEIEWSLLGMEDRNSFLTTLFEPL